MQVTAIVADVRALPFADHSVDLIIDKGTMDALNGSVDKERMLRECLRVLRPPHGLLLQISFGTGARLELLDRTIASYASGHPAQASGHPAQAGEPREPAATEPAGTVATACAYKASLPPEPTACADTASLPPPPPHDQHVTMHLHAGGADAGRMRYEYVRRTYVLGDHDPHRSGCEIRFVTLISHDFGGVEYSPCALSKTLLARLQATGSLYVTAEEVEESAHQEALAAALDAELSALAY